MTWKTKAKNKLKNRTMAHDEIRIFGRRRACSFQNIYGLICVMCHRAVFEIFEDLDKIYAIFQKNFQQNIGFFPHFFGFYNSNLSFSFDKQCIKD